MRYAFDDFVLDTDCRELRRNDTLVAAEPQVFDLIAFIVANRHRVVSRDDLLEAVWHGRIISESTLAARVNAARRALGDSGAAQRLIRTVRGHGFRFVGDLVEEQVQRDGRLEHKQLVIAVLPFENLSGEPQFDRLAAAFCEDLTDALAKLPGKAVVAAGPARGDPCDVAGTLGVRHLIAGSVRGSHQNLRVTVRLVDGVTGICLWSDRYDRSLTDSFAQTDDIVRRALLEIATELDSGCPTYNDGARTHSLDAWLLHRQGLHEWLRFGRAANVRARQLFLQANEADPDWPVPLACIGSTYREDAARRWDASPERKLELALEIGERAAAAGPDYACVLTYFATTLVNAGRVDEGLRLGERAIEIAPSDSFALSDFAFNLPRAGEVARSLAYFARARKVRPVPGYELANEAFVLHLAGRCQQAIELLKKCGKVCDMPLIPVRLAAAYFEAGRVEHAKETIEEVLARQPDATIGEYTGDLPFPDRQRAAWYRDLLRGAGLPERFA